MSPPHLNPGSIKYRDADRVMKLSRLGAFHQTRLSFMRVMLRRLVAEKWQFSRSRFEMDDKGVGVAIYCAQGPHNTYSLVVFSNDLPAHKRSDRVIATEWDATFTLFDGVPEQKDVDRLKKNIPLQEAGRASEKELCLSRANRSVRLWEHVVTALSQGRQPDLGLIRSVGYLMRTTAVYGSGKFGVSDRERIMHREECRGPFQMEMLTVYLIRTFVIDLVEHMARVKNPDKAVGLNASIKRALGIGNSTGLGMAPFLMNHPMLINNWILAKEEALLRVRQIDRASPKEITYFNLLLRRALQNAVSWTSDHPLQQEKLSLLRQDLTNLIEHVSKVPLVSRYPWEHLMMWGQENLSYEGQEQLISLMLEPYGDLVDGLSDCMDADETLGLRIDGRVSLHDLKSICKDVYGWALCIDWSDRSQTARAWYISEEKLEPRLGERHIEDIADFEQPLQPGRDVARMFKVLEDYDDRETTASFLMRHPEFRHVVRRCQIALKYPYSEIRDNTISAEMMPIDLLRAKLSFFGAGHFDPRSDRWVRINMFQGAPFPDELADQYQDDWVYPALSVQG